MSKTIETKDKLVTAESLKWVHDKLDMKIDGGLFQEFDETATYAVGDYVIYNGYLYKMIHSHTGAWDASDAEQVDFMESLNDLGDRELAFTDPNNDGNIVIVGNNTAVVDDSIYTAINDAKSDCENIIAPAFSTSTAYAIGDHCIYNDELYVFTAAHAAGAWNSAHATKVTVGSEIEDINEAISDVNDAISTNYSELKSDLTFDTYDNILPTDSKSSVTQSGITWSRTNGVYSFNGTATGNINITLAGGSDAIPDGFEVGKTYYIDSDVKNSDLQLRIFGYQNGTSTELRRFSSATSYRPTGLFTVPSGYDAFLIRWYIPKNGVLTNFTAKPTIAKYFSDRQITDLLFSECDIDFPLSGYINTSDGTLVPPVAEYQEVTSYMVYGAYGFLWEMTFANSRRHQPTLAVYDRDGNFIQTMVLNTDTSPTSSEFRDIRFYNANAYSFRLFFRTFGESYTSKLSVISTPALLASDYSKFAYDAPINFATSAETKANRIRSSIGQNALRYDKYLDHLFSDGANGQGVKVPWESLFHVRISHRLGFKVIEANVHALSDGNYLVMHGSTTPGYEAFGNSVYHVDETTDISAVAFSSVSLDWVKTNVRYKCTVDKFKVAPPSLQEFLHECRTLGMIPLVQLISSDLETVKPELEIVDGIMGKDNYIAYIRPDGGSDALREYCSAPFSRWSNLASKDDIVAWVQKMNPCVYGMSNYSDFTDAELTEIVDAVHQNNGLLCSAYLSEADRIRLFKLGFDFVSAKYNINYFTSGNLCNLTADLAFTDFTTTGTVSGNILTLSADDTVTPNATLNSEYLSGACLEIVFDGTISISMGDFIDGVEIASDGTEVIPMSTYFIGSAPTFTITAVSQTNIYMLTYKASKF